MALSYTELLVGRVLSETLDCLIIKCNNGGFGDWRGTDSNITMRPIDNAVSVIVLLR